MDALAQNTLTLAAGANETFTFRSAGGWSLLNQGPGTLWVSWTPGIPAAVGAPDCTPLAAGLGYTHTTTGFGEEVNVDLLADQDVCTVLFALGAGSFFNG
jgi:hypothetical protein